MTKPEQYTKEKDEGLSEQNFWKRKLFSRAKVKETCFNMQYSGSQETFSVNRTSERSGSNLPRFLLKMLITGFLSLSLSVKLNFKLFCLLDYYKVHQNTSLSYLCWEFPLNWPYFPPKIGLRWCCSLITCSLISFIIWIYINCFSLKVFRIFLGKLTLFTLFTLVLLVVFIFYFYHHFQ